MKLIRFVFGAVLLLSVGGLKAQTADEIVSKHINAIGGKEVINKIKSQVIESDLSVMGASLSSVSTILVGKGFKNVANFNGQDIVQCITPTSGWSINPLAGSSDVQAIPEEDVKAAQSALYVGGDLSNYKERENKIELSGRETLEGINTYKIKLVAKDGKETFYYIDPATYYVVKRESITKVGGEDITSVSTFANHKKTDFGLVMPYTTITNQGFEITITINKVEFNKEIDPKIFEIPKQ